MRANQVPAKGREPQSCSFRNEITLFMFLKFMLANILFINTLNTKVVPATFVSLVISCTMALLASSDVYFV